MKTISVILQFLIGLLMTLALIGAGVTAAALYLAAKHSAQPERPVFSEEIPTSKPASQAKNSPKLSKPGSTSSAETSSPSTDTPKPLEAGAYRARVTWAQGLLLRDRPSFESNGLSGIAFNERIVVLEETSDKEWQRVRLENSDREGWVKGGNTERLNE